ncbi:RHS repeat-associated core domain-containing protein [Nonomuraea sp. NPDC003201]
MQIEPAAADPVRTRLEVPQSPSRGATSSIPVQQTGTAKNLPHLVGPEDTQAKVDTRPVKVGKRPKDALPLDEPHELVDSSIVGLKSPPSLPKKSTSEPEPVVRPAGRVPAVAPVLHRAEARNTVQAAAGEPVVSLLAAGPGTPASGSMILSSPKPWFEAKVTDPNGRTVGLNVEVEHDPSVPAQGTGQIWSYTGGAGDPNGSTVRFTAPYGVLHDGWLIRWRARGHTPAGTQSLYGPWSDWQLAKLDISKPAASELAAGPGGSADGQWILSSLTPWFEARVTDPDGRKVGISVEVEHDPSAAGQGTGQIWSYTGGSADPSGSYVSSSMPSGLLKDGWLIRWRIRGLTPTETSDILYGPWSGWQAGRVDLSKPVASNLAASPGTTGSGLTTLSSLTPSLEAKVSDPDGRTVGMSVEIEHDPSVPSQGSGRIWSYTGGAGDPNGSTVRLTVGSGVLRDGWLVRWRARGITPSGTQNLYGRWSGWQTARIDLSKPTASNLAASPGTTGSGLTTLSSLTPSLEAKVSDPDGRTVGMSVEIEHDPSVPSQGSGRIWSYTGGAGDPNGSTVRLTVGSGVLRDGWLVRWRARGITPSGTQNLYGPWSTWQSARVDITKPAVSALSAAPGVSGTTLSTLTSLTPSFGATVSDAEGRNVGLEVDVEHDPSAPSQGSGKIWGYTGGAGNPSGSALRFAIDSGKLRDGWLIRWRARGHTPTQSSQTLYGPWSVWQTARVEVGNPVGTGLGAVPATQGSGLWTLSSLTPWLYSKITSPNGTAAFLGAEIEHDPSEPGQGTGLIWSGQGTTSYASGSNAWVQVPSGKLTDGWRIRWRVRGVPVSGTAGAWSDWQSAVVTLTQPGVAGVGMTPGTSGTDGWTLPSLTPWVFGKVTSSEGRASYLGVEIEHDPSVPAQGAGLIWSGQGTTSYASGSNAWAQVPVAKLTDGWMIRWRARGVTTNGIKGPWSDWQPARVNLSVPAVEALGMAPARRSTASWSATTLTPSLYAKVTDPDNRASQLSIEVEHDPAVPTQGTGLIYAGKSTTSYPSGTNAWMAVPTGKLQDGWLFRWRVRAVTTTGVSGPWSEWQSGVVTALPFLSFSPGANSQVGTLEPTLSAFAQSANEDPVTYWFQLCAGTSPNWTWCDSSLTWEKSGTWKVSNTRSGGAHKLAWGQTYWWQAKATSGTTTVTSSWRAFTPTPEQGTINASLAAGTDGRAFNHSSGNFTNAETDASVAVVGPPLNVTRTYNSLDPRTGGVFGSGWSTRWDMRIEPEPQTSTLLVTYPGGEQSRFAAKGEGTYAPPSGTFATLSTLPEGGWRLMDKSATSYWFDANGRLIKVTDHRNRTQELTYGSDGKLAKATSPGGRSLTFTWTGNHVTSVSTDPVDGNAITWTYHYDGDNLVKICPPTSTTACTVYTYAGASRYRSAVLDSGPTGYWRLNETSTALGTKIDNSAPWIPEPGDEAKISGTAADATPAVPGALSGSADTAMRFKGTSDSAYITLPQAAISGQGGNVAVEAWFKTTSAGTILGYQNSASRSPSAFTPVLYVGTDGKLRGQFYTGAPAPITTAAPVNDGGWHHVVLSAAENTQTLFLDGQVVGTLGGEITHVGQWETRIGSGFGSSAWPATTTSTGTFSFAGDIDEVAVYGKPIGLQLVKTHYAARSPQSQLIKAVAPSGRTEAENVYAADGGRLAQHTDGNGGVWKLSAPVYTKETTVYIAATTTVADPHGGMLTYVDDALHGNRQVSKSDQLGKTTRYTYDTGGYPAKVYDPNGNVVELAYNTRGNLLSRKTCRTVDSCSSEFFSYYLNIDNLFDPRNDLRTGHRDARSTSVTDETYLTSWSFNVFGEETKQTTPATPDFPQGRSKTATHTDGTEPAVGGGLTPAGLVKSSKDFKGNETTYAYTAAGDLATQTSPTGLVKKFEYDALGRPVTQAEISAAFPEGVKTTIAYDGLSRIVSRTDSGVKNEVTGVTHTSQWSATYDADGNKLTESRADLTGGDTTRTTTYTYDAYGRLETSTGPEGGVQRFAHDHKGQKTSFTDERGTTYHYAYTSRGELATTTLKGWTGSPVDPQPATDVIMTSNAYDPGGRLASQTDVMGRTTVFTYYNDNLPAEQSAKGARLNGLATPRDVVLDSRKYDAAGHIVRQTADGGTLAVAASYDAAGRITNQTVDPDGLKRATTFSYDANGNVIKTTLTAPGTDRSEVTEYAYDSGDQLVRKSVHNEGADLVTTLTVDDRGLVTAITDPRGNLPGAAPSAFTTSMTYDALDLAVEVRLPAVSVERAGSAPVIQRPTAKMGYNTFGEQTHQVDAEGRVLTSTLDRAGRVVAQATPTYKPPGGQPITPVATAGYDAAGQLVSATSSRGQTTTAVYDGLGNKVQVTDPKVGQSAAGTWTYTYDLLGEILSQTAPTAARSEATYDDLGRQITLSTIERKPAQAVYVTRMEYDDGDRVTKTIRPTGDSTSRAYDPTGALISQTDALGNATKFAYDLAGRVVKTTNPLGLANIASYDLAGRQIQSQDLDVDGSVLRTKKTGYDAAGNETSRTSAEGHTITRVFDAANRQVEQREPVSPTEQITTSFGYDAAGAQTRSTSGRGHSTYTTYNSLGLPESVIEPATAAHPNPADRTWTLGYDAVGNPVTTVAPGGVRVERVFDELNRLIKQSGSGAEATTEDLTFGYDLAGRLTAAGDLGFTLNDRGLLLKTTGAGGDLNAYAYDANNRLVQRVDTTGTSIFTWDDADRLTQSMDPVSATTIGYGYDTASRLINMSYGQSGARRAYTYDALNRLTKDQLTTSAGGAIASVEYDYDLDDNLITKTTAGTASAGKNTYSYDWSNRLTSWTAPDGNKTAYEWDAAGNRTRAGSKTYTYDERNRLTSGDGHTYTYTARGTLAEDSSGIVRITRFDAFDRLTQDNAVTYDYDSLGRVETRTESGQTTRFAYDGQSNNLVAITDGNNVKTASYGRDALGRTLGISDGVGAQLAFCDLRGDLIGSFTADGTALADSVTYDPFGEVVTRTGNAHALGYQGAYTDPSTGKTNMAARWYQAGTGSFVSRDTLTQNADPSVQLNRYAYANANPLTNIDPDGHKSVSKVMKAAKATTKKTTPLTLSSCKSKFGAKPCAEVKQDHPECVEYYGTKGCKKVENVYLQCRQKQTQTKCEQQEIRAECASGARHQPYESTTCKYTVADYTACRKNNLRGECRDGAFVYAGCLAGGYGRDKCGEGSDIYQSCRAANRSNRSWSREMCSNEELIHRDCRVRNDSKTCEYVAGSYEDCRMRSKRGHDGCKFLADNYFSCRSSKSYGKHDDWFCRGVQESLSFCVKDTSNSMSRCADVPKIYMECAKKNGQAGCVSEDDRGARGSTCDPAKDITDALTYSCDIYLSTQQVNLLNVVLAGVGTVAGLCAMSVALAPVCGYVTAVVAIAATAINVANSKGRGVVITYQSIMGNESVTVKSQ